MLCKCFICCIAGVCVSSAGAPQYSAGDAGRYAVCLLILHPLHPAHTTGQDERDRGQILPWQLGEKTVLIVSFTKCDVYIFIAISTLNHQVVSIYMGITVNLVEAWEPYKAAKIALNYTWTQPTSRTGTVTWAVSRSQHVRSKPVTSGLTLSHCFLLSGRSIRCQCGEFASAGAAVMKGIPERRNRPGQHSQLLNCLRTVTLPSAGWCCTLQSPVEMSWARKDWNQQFSTFLTIVFKDNRPDILVLLL